MLFNEDSVILDSAHDRDAEHLDSFDFTAKAQGRPGDYVQDGELGMILVSIAATDADEEEIVPVTTTPADDEEDGEHVCHFVYDQFGRLVCTGCNKVKHTECIDMDEDGICDECGLERDFCPDCHVGGTCRCI